MTTDAKLDPQLSNTNPRVEGGGLQEGAESQLKQRERGRLRPARAVNFLRQAWRFGAPAAGSS